MLTIYNSLSRQKEPFVPLVPGKIGMYVCGVTVYDDCHLGHGRSMVCFDAIVRFLRSEGYQVTFVRNITDIDDKIIARAAERHVSIDALTSQYITALHEDAQLLGTLMPDIEPRATEHISDIIALIQRLLDADFAYQTEQGDICFEVEHFNDYGKLSNQNIAELISGSRIEVALDKHSPMDFVLWKKAKPLEPSWPSPWGEGRPGWHIECSAMAMHQLGESFDIHGGGQDLQFPHHENEIAQSEAATGHTYARYWVHVGMLQVNDEKMSKSLGNFFTIKEVLKQYHPEVARYFLLSSHYRSTLNYSDDHITNSSKALMRLYQSLRGIDIEDSAELDKTWLDKFRTAMLDDFNTPIALSVLFELSHEVNKTQSIRLAYTLRYLGKILGILQRPVDSFLQGQDRHTENDANDIERLIAQRTQARLEKNWHNADEVRQLLLSKGIELEDTPSGTVWRKTLL